MKARAAELGSGIRAGKIVLVVGDETVVAIETDDRGNGVLGVRAAAAQTRWFRSKEEALVVCAAEGVELWEAGIDSVRYRGRECENRDLVGWTVMEKDLLRLL